MSVNTTEYDFSKIEKHQQELWEKNKTFKAENFSDKPKYYILDMFPYPSGAGLHIGHPEGYTASDILARYKKANGFNVLHPMGWDAFGLPAEQYAIKTGTHPAITTKKNVDNFRKQIKSIGFAIDWDREINTTDPNYFRWTQWIFLRLFKMGLAYVDEKPVWWCPKLGTVLANEEVIDGKSEVGHFPVEKRNLRQWVLKITAYADKLLKDLDLVDWPDSTKKLQKNWIGRSEGARVDFKLEDFGETLTVFTTRPDTLYGATYMVIAPEHPLVSKITSAEHKAEMEAYLKKTASKSDLDRTDLAKDKTGVFTGTFATNPLTGAKIPVWVSDYVLMSYGTGAIMAVPAHDERDWEFAQKFKLPIIKVIEKKDENGNDVPLPFTAVGKMVNSGEFTGQDSADVKKKIIAFLEEKKVGKLSVNYKLRDWLFSRQRYWGEPFPIVWVEQDAYQKAIQAKGDVFKNMPESEVSFTLNGVKHFALPLADSQLPLKLPEVTNYQGAGNGESALANCPEWKDIYYNVQTGESVPQSAGKPEGEMWFKAVRETNTMPQWAGSCWYYLRYLDNKNDKAPFDPEIEKYWQGPDFYIGGAEHAVLHLLYARFWHKVLYDCKIVSTKEPFKRLFHQGIILGKTEYKAFKKNGKYVSALSEDAKDAEGESVDEKDVVKSGTNFVLKSNPEIVVEARSYKMSKSRGNVVNPDDVIAQYGADSLRMYEMFLGPLEDQKPWSTSGIEGVSRFLKKFWREYIDRDGKIAPKICENFKDSPETLRLANQTIQKVGADIENLRFNTAISQMMIFLSHVQKCEKISKDLAVKFLQILAPFAPHICEEIWQRFGNTSSIAEQKWPVADMNAAAQAEKRIGVQVNGKLRGDVLVSPQDTPKDIIAKAKAIDKVAAQLAGKTLVKEIYVPNRIVSLVVK